MCQRHVCRDNEKTAVKPKVRACELGCQTWRMMGNNESIRVPGVGGQKKRLLPISMETARQREMELDAPSAP